MTALVCRGRGVVKRKRRSYYCLIASMFGHMSQVAPSIRILQYESQTYPSIRGRTIFRAKDRLALTKGIIDSIFDMGVLQVVTLLLHRKYVSLSCFESFRCRE